MVFSEEYDHDKTFSVDERVRWAKQYSKLLIQVGPYIGTMATALEQALAAETEARWVAGERRGRRFARRQLAEWTMGGEDDRIYKRIEQGVKLDTCVCLLWDCSGSMGPADRVETKAALARLAAIGFHEALVRAAIPHEVLGFNTGGARVEELSRLVAAAKERGESLKHYSRLADTDNRFVFIEYGQTDGRALCAISGNHANRDGECVLWAARRLARRPEKRKILIVGSDGQPQGALFHGTERRHLKAVVQRATLAGLETYAIGIMDESVRHYYPNWTVIRKPADLPRVVMGHLLRLLTKGTTYAREGAARAL